MREGIKGLNMNESTKNLYFVNAWVDTLFIGGLSSIVFFLMLFFQSGVATATVLSIGVALSWICNNPHFAATTYKLYKSKENRRQFPFTSYVVPVLVLGMVMASIAYPKTIAPFLIKFFFIWSPFHFSGQSFGISMVYAKRAGFKMGNFERQALKIFIYSSFIGVLFRVDSYIQTSTHYNIKFLALNVPESFYDISLAVMIISGICLGFSVYKHKKKNEAALPMIVLLPAFTHLIWFIGGAYHDAFNGLVPFFHSAQYLFIAWAMQTKDVVEKAKTENVLADKFFVAKKTTIWFVINCIVGAGMFEGLPLIFPAASLDPMITMGIVVVGVQVHHFFVDGVIWKLKSQHETSPLLVNVSDYIEKTPELVEVKI
jgi:hypothetical protein